MKEISSKQCHVFTVIKHLMVFHSLVFEGNMKFPQTTALALGKSEGAFGIVVDMHYNNPLLQAGKTDASSLRFYLTSKPREHKVKLHRLTLVA